jgi:hypothetical protein
MKKSEENHMQATVETMSPLKVIGRILLGMAFGAVKEIHKENFGDNKRNEHRHIPLLGHYIDKVLIHDVDRERYDIDYSYREDINALHLDVIQKYYDEHPDDDIIPMF